MTQATLKNRSHIFAEYRVFVWLILKPTQASSPGIFTDISCRHQRAWVQIPLSAQVIYSPICLLIVIEQNEVWFWWKFIRWKLIRWNSSRWNDMVASIVRSHSKRSDWHTPDNFFHSERNISYLFRVCSLYSYRWL